VQVSAKNLSHKASLAIHQHLATAISEVKNIDQAKQFLTDFLTSTERVVLAKRLAIGLLLHKKIAYEEIKNTLNVSSATISAVSTMMKHPGFKLAIEKINEEEWAETQLRKFTNLFKK